MTSTSLGMPAVPPPTSAPTWKAAWDDALYGAAGFFRRESPIAHFRTSVHASSLFARALGSDAQVILMDDPMRGVDIGTKREVYELIAEEALKGRTFLWYTTEFDELFHCDRVAVFRDGRIVGELSAYELTEDKVLQFSFHEAGGPAHRAEAGA